MGARLAFAIDVPPELRDHPFPPMLLISLVENAIKHGIEPAAARRHASTIRARRDGDARRRHGGRHGRGLEARGSAGQGIGLPTSASACRAVRRARRGLHSSRASPRGARATLAIPFEAADR